MLFRYITGKGRVKRCRTKAGSSSNSSDTSRISAASMKLILDKLTCHSKRDSTKKMYLGIWRRFNDFLMKLDKKPDSWEDRTSLFIAYLVEGGTQSGTVKSYVSTIKTTLQDDKYEWQDNLILLNALTRGCKVLNDKYSRKQPISCNLLEMILFEIQSLWCNAPILENHVFCLVRNGIPRIFPHWEN